MNRAVTFILGLLMLMPAMAAEPVVVYLTLKDHLFFPSRLEVPANIKLKLIIKNLDSSPEEFDSFDLNREKVIFANRQSTIYIGPLKEGVYEFFGEYNSSTARGALVAIKREGESDVN